MIRRDCFRQREVKQHGVRQGEAAGKKKRHVDSPATQDPTNRRTEDKAESKRRTNQSHALRAIFFAGDIRDVSLCSRDVTAGNSVDDSADEEHQECGRKSQDQKSQCRAQQTRQQDGRRPYLSESRPRIGAKTSCITEYEANNKPTWLGVAPNFVPSA